NSKNSEHPETIFEWIDYSKFTILEQIEFSKNHKAYWEEGHILSWNAKSKKWNRHGGQRVKLVTHYCEKYLTSNFLKSEYESSKVNPSNRLVYGMTRDPATKDYAVVEKLIDICPGCGQEWMCLRWCSAYWKKGRIQKWCTISDEWKRDDPMWVAMKSVENDDECGLLEEVKNLHQCLKVNLYSLDCYGITRHPITRKYLIVMRYAEEGDLRAFLSSNFKTYTWKNRLDRLWGLATDIRSIHEKDLVHRDLHGGNVLFGAGRRSFVADLGLTCQDGQKWLEIISGNYIPTKETNEIKSQFEQAEEQRQRNPYPVTPLSKLTTHPKAILTKQAQQALRM
ncbi:34337_t:CDS:2, partial [Gigaspora margarita]